MQHIDLTGIPEQETYGHTSKGNQMKWSFEGRWYKADHMGYEGLAETLVSRLLADSSIGVPYVRYEPAQICCDGKTMTGCVSSSFLQEGETLLPVEKLYRKATGNSLALELAHIREDTERIRFFVEQLEQITGLTDVGPYLTAMLETDAFFLNEDRHTNNIAVIYHDTTRRFRLCPLFDHGLSLLADTWQDFPLERSLEDCLAHVEAKPFCRKFDDQLDAAEELYGVQLRFRFTMAKVCTVLEELRPLYGDAVCSRVEQIMRIQMRHYQYLVK